eukprot:363049-Chlamydomonas_euryale.AAC.11
MMIESLMAGMNLLPCVTSQIPLSCEIVKIWSLPPLRSHQGCCAISDKTRLISLVLEKYSHACEGQGSTYIQRQLGVYPPVHVSMSTSHVPAHAKQLMTAIHEGHKTILVRNIYRTNQWLVALFTKASSKQVYACQGTHMHFVRVVAHPSPTQHPRYAQQNFNLITTTSLRLDKCKCMHDEVRGVAHACKQILCKAHHFQSIQRSVLPIKGLWAVPEAFIQVVYVDLRGATCEGKRAPTAGHIAGQLRTKAAYRAAQQPELP